MASLSAGRETPLKIVSGGQTGADRAALDWAIERGLEHGGWCPRGRRAEDGAVPLQYRLTETPTERWEQRTEWNVRDSDGTVIFTVSETLTGGSLMTAEFARVFGRPCLHLSRRVDGDLAGPKLRRFVDDHAIRVLNVAGPRASGEPGVGQFVRTTLDAALGTP
jgi:hypothetical protein